MTVGAKLAAFAVILAACFGAGAAIGAAVGPIDIDGGDAPADHQMPDGGHGDMDMHDVENSEP